MYYTYTLCIYIYIYSCSNALFFKPWQGWSKCQEFSILLMLSSNLSYGSIGQRKFPRAIFETRRCCHSTFLPYRPNPDPGRQCLRSESLHSACRRWRWEGRGQTAKEPCDAIASLCQWVCLCIPMALLAFIAAAMHSFSSRGKAGQSAKSSASC